MRNFLLLCLCFINSPFLWAESTIGLNEAVQVDVIVFQHMATGMDANESSLISVIMTGEQTGTPLQSAENCNSHYYCLLSLSASDLKQSWYSLSRQPDYQMLARYSWLQPEKNARSVVIPDIIENDMRIKGQLRLQKGTYYYFSSNLAIYAANRSEPVVIKQHVRLKANQTVYLDNPYIGILLRVHPVSV